MAEHELELRLRAAARELDAQAPAFDLGLLRSRASSADSRKGRRARVRRRAWPASPRRRPRSRRYSICSTSTRCRSSAPLAPGVAPPFAGRSVPVDAVQASVPFRVRMIPSLGAPDEARVRDDITGGMVTIAYEGGRILLTQWRTTDVHARIALVPVSGAAEDVAVGDLPALWIEGTARGTFTLIGADGARPPRELRGRHRRAALERRRDDVPPPGRRFEGESDVTRRLGRRIARLEPTVRHGGVGLGPGRVSPLS